MKKKMYIFLSFLLILVFFLTSCSNNQVTVKEKIDKANYVIVNIRPQFEQLYYLDLKSKLYYGDGNASDNNLYYADNHPYSNKKLGFEHFKNVDMLYPIIADKTSTPKIQRSNFIIEKEITKPKYIINILRGNGFTGNKIKIFYNRQCSQVHNPV
ncbi:hypothetical protein FEE37_12090 [Lactobacillus murinus]|uniref:hypothetical protein n=1 Tax=Ligilactobacillus murinus TaxID=1622 RepID=UPI0013D26845|nr:hypothetical protein [Ligilactobacillus murinus]NEF97410.1 hypothetical protein [Ligilactobacillus murinus]